VARVDAEVSMRRIVALCIMMIVSAVAAGCADRQASFLEVRMTGDARVYGQYFSNRNFTGWK
jgi:hypothetical protein